MFDPRVQSQWINSNPWIAQVEAQRLLKVGTAGMTGHKIDPQVTRDGSNAKEAEYIRLKYI